MWEIILNKENILQAETVAKVFDDYNVQKIVNYKEDTFIKLLGNKNIIHNRRKINIAINNAKIFVSI